LSVAWTELGLGLETRPNPARNVITLGEQESSPEGLEIFAAYQRKDTHIADGSCALATPSCTGCLTRVLDERDAALCAQCLEARHVCNLPKRMDNHDSSGTVQVGTELVGVECEGVRINGGIARCTSHALNHFHE